MQGLQILDSKNLDHSTAGRDKVLYNGTGAKRMNNLCVHCILRCAMRWFAQLRIYGDLHRTLMRPLTLYKATAASQSPVKGKQLKQFLLTPSTSSVSCAADVSPVMVLSQTIVSKSMERKGHSYAIMHVDRQAYTTTCSCCTCSVSTLYIPSCCLNGRMNGHSTVHAAQQIPRYLEYHMT